MNPKLFTDSRTGSLREIQIAVLPGAVDDATRGPRSDVRSTATRTIRDFAFIPDPLPLRLSLPDHVTSRVAEARARLGELAGIGRTLPNPEFLLRPLQQREAFHSSSMEGTTVVPSELLQLDARRAALQPHGSRAGDLREVHNHGRALQAGRELLDELPFCARVTRHIHARLLAGVRGEHKRPGEFRTRQVYVGGDRRYVPPPAEEVPRLLHELDRFTNVEHATIDPLVRAFMAHYQFEAIHPFLDGNGRVGRVLLSLHTHRWLEHAHPWLYLSAYFEEHKAEYVRRMFQVSANGEWAAWIEFCLEATIRQCENAILRCDTFTAVRGRLHELYDGLGPRAAEIIDRACDQPVFSVADVVDWTGRTRPTAQKDVDQLLRTPAFHHLRGERPRWYYLPCVVTARFSPDPRDALLELPPHERDSPSR